MTHLDRIERCRDGDRWDSCRDGCSVSKREHSRAAVRLMMIAHWVFRTQLQFHPQGCHRLFCGLPKLKVEEHLQNYDLFPPHNTLDPAADASTGS